MGKYAFLYIFILTCCLQISSFVSAQVTGKEDTFFLARKKGLWGKLGRSITTTPESEPPVKIADPYEKFRGRIIRSVEIHTLGFNQNLDDTTIVKDNLALRIANRVHINTKRSVIRNHLFFKQGDKFLPLLISDNESFLRNQPFLQDALIVVVPDEISGDSVDIAVLTRDVFSIGGSVNANTSRIRTELREENIAGSGSQISLSGIYDLDRKPQTGLGAEFILRNIRGTFLNCMAGFTTFQNAFNSGRFEENSSYLLLEKPLVNRYSKWTAFLEIASNKTFNAYISDSIYQSDSKYKYNNVDIWAGYNFSSKGKKGTDS